jgi:hypothetical protein
MTNYLALQHGREQRPHRFHQQARVPDAARTDLHVGGITGFGMTPCVCEDDHDIVQLSNQWLKLRVVDVHRGTVPGTDQAPLVHEMLVLGSGLFRSSVAWFVLSVPAHVLLGKRW